MSEPIYRYELGQKVVLIGDETKKHHTIVDRFIDIDSSESYALDDDYNGTYFTFFLDWFAIEPILEPDDAQLEQMDHRQLVMEA